MKTTKVAAIRAGLILMFVMTTVGLRSAAACSCQENPPCAAAWRADAVFVGLVIDSSPERAGGNLDWTVHKMAVNQTLKGAIDPYITLVPGERPSEERIAAAKAHPGRLVMMSTCDYRFERGRQYVIYATRTKNGEWTTSMCSGTKLLEQAAEDLDYLSTIPFAEPTGRVYGSIERTVADPADRNEVKAVPASGVTVALTSDFNRLTVKTDLEGKLDVHVPPGEYTIAPVVPQAIRVYGSGARVSVPSRGCAPVHFSLISNGRIEGRVLRSDGTGVGGLYVDVIPADWPIDRRLDLTMAPSGTTDEKGRFSIDAILPGRYVLAVNARYGPRLDSPYATTYFPGVGRDDAQAFEFAEGERKTGLLMVVNPLAETTVSGMVVGDDDRPIAGASVRAAVARHAGMLTDSATTDGNGTFQLRALIGVAYTITAGIQTDNGFRHSDTAVLVDERREGLRLVIRR